jgi:hypothetical protein
MKTLAQRIQEALAALNTTRDRLIEATKSLDDAADTASIDAVTTLVDQLTIQAETEVKSLEALQRAEKILAGRATTAANDPAAGASSGAPAHLLAPRGMPSKEKAANLIVRAAVVAFEAYHKHEPVEAVLQRRYGDDEPTRAVVLQLTTKAAQNPAMTSVAGWAQELTRVSYGAFIDLLTPESVIPRMPLARYDFAGSSKILIPMRAGGVAGLTTPNLAGAFRAEGDPIRVGSVQTTSLALTPKSLGVIGTYTMELLERSTPSIETIIQNAMTRDTGIALDLAFLGANAGSAKQPPGLQTFATGANTRPSSGNNVAQITADIRSAAQQMAATGNGRRPVWLMNDARAIGISLALTAAGTLAFPTMADNMLLGYPVIRSLNVPSDIVFLVDAAEIPFAGDAPRFLGTEVATLHEEDTAPLPIASTGAPNTVAAPARSLFQTNSAALRAIWDVDWNSLMAGAVQTITACAW